MKVTLALLGAGVITFAVACSSGSSSVQQHSAKVKQEVAVVEQSPQEQRNIVAALTELEGCVRPQGITFVVSNPSTHPVVQVTHISPEGMIKFGVHPIKHADTVVNCVAPPSRRVAIKACVHKLNLTRPIIANFILGVGACLVGKQQ